MQVDNTWREISELDNQFDAASPLRPRLLRSPSPDACSEEATRHNLLSPRPSTQNCRYGQDASPMPEMSEVLR